MRKTHLSLFFLLLLMFGCTTFDSSDVVEAPLPPSATWQPATLPATWTPFPELTNTPTMSTDFLPAGLRIALISDDKLQLWHEGKMTILLSKESIWDPLISPDGEWIVFRQEVSLDPLEYEIWAVRSDGSDLNRLLSTEDLKRLADDDSHLFVNWMDWIPTTHQLLFNTDKLIDGPPGAWPAFDLNLLDISGDLRQLAVPGEGGDFFPSPDGRYVATSTTSRIALIDLETGENQAMLEFDPLMIPTEAYRTPDLFWDRTSQHFTATIPPPNIYTPSDWPRGYAGGLEQIWRMHITGEVELLVEVEPAVGWPTVLSISPYAEYYFNIELGTCGDGAFFISHLHTLPEGEKLLTLPCWPEFPNWLPDGISYHYRSDEGWHLGNVNEPITHDIDFVRLPAAENVWPPNSLKWIDTSSFILRNNAPEGCHLYLGTRDGILLPLIKTTDHCPSLHFRLPAE